MTPLTVPVTPRAVVTGAAGFIGRALVRYLVNAGTDVIAVDRKPFTSTARQSITLDLATPGALQPLLDETTTLYHLAASADVARSVQHPKDDFRNTFYALFETLEAARSSGCRMIFPSTASVFDMSAPSPLDERAFARPTSPYAAGKLAGEAYCYAYHRSYGLDVRVARMFSVYGEGMYRFAIHDLVRKIQEDPQEVLVLGDGSQVRDYLHVDDALRGLVLIATNGAPGEDYNLAYGRPTNILDLTRTIAMLMQCPDIRIVLTGKSFPGDTPRWFADISKIRSIGFEPDVDLEAGLRRTIAWLCRVNMPGLVSG